MGEPQSPTVGSTSDEIFDRYTLPKVALTIILLASLLGTYLTLRLGGTASLHVVLAKWGYLVTLGVLVGGFCWKHVFVRPDDLDDGTEAYCTRMYSRFNRIVLVSVVVLTVTGAVVVRRYWQSLADGVLPGVVTLLLVGLLTALVAILFRLESLDGQFRSPLGLVAFGLAISLLGVTASAEVTLRGGSTAALAVRVLHLSAFAVWLGGAVWNIFVAVPTGQKFPTVPVVRAAGQQLERFRWAVRLIIPTIVATGLYQAYSVFGVTLDVYLDSVVGFVVVAKLGFLGVLVVIFKLCPMWRACSPIEGVCELDEFDNSEQTEGEDD